MLGRKRRLAGGTKRQSEADLFAGKEGKLDEGGLDAVTAEPIPHL
jgi:hypothetical protein